MEYIDFRTLAILFCLMAVMAGLQKIGLFRYTAEKLLGKVQHVRGIIFILIMLCFFSSMLITNDVALITFVPFTFIILNMILGNHAEKLVVPVVVMQTIAANLGSMLTPIGNPQNLYLFGKSSLSLGDFLLLMLPYTVIAFAILAGWCLLFPYKGEKRLALELKEKTSLAGHGRELVTYVSLFLLCLLTVAHLLPYGVTFLIVLVVVFIMDRNVLRKVDYTLLLTFIVLFILIGNLGRVQAVHAWIQEMIDGNEVLISVVASQFMSNVPAAVLLSGFTTQYERLIVGTNLGGLGTMIASMASLISFKYIGKEYKHLRVKYFVYFTVANLLFLFMVFLSAHCVREFYSECELLHLL